MNNYLKNGDWSACCGCYACISACPVKCISMKPTKEGFMYPVVEDASICINCGLCSRVCPVEQNNTNKESTAFYAAYSNNKDIVSRSSSGGIFGELAAHFLGHGGIVFGAYLNDEHRLSHIAIHTVDEIKKLQSSKYIQSEIGNSYSECEGYLKAGKIVFFTGTPCQIQGLKLYLKRPYDNLFTADVICHGVPSQKMFDAYVNYLEKKHHAKLVDINFRDKKRNGWSITLRYTMQYPFGRRKDYYLISKLSEYFTGFLGGYISRESCYKCQYSSMKRPGDITLGDFWGYQKTRPELKHDEGLSIVLVTTEKGREMLKALSGVNVCLTEVNSESLESSENKNLYKPTKRPSPRDYIFKELDEDGFDYIANKYFRKWHTWRIKMRYALPPFLFNVLDKLRGK